MRERLAEQRTIETSLSTNRKRGTPPHLVLLVVLLLAFGSLSPSLLGQIPAFVDGTWTGTHTNGFGGSPGPVSLVVDVDGNNVTLTVDVGGVVFGNLNPAPFVLGPAPFNGVQVQFNDPLNPVYGNLMVTIQVDGSAVVTFNNPPNNIGVVSGSSTGNIRPAGDPACAAGFPPLIPALASPCLTGTGTLVFATGGQTTGNTGLSKQAAGPTPTSTVTSTPVPTATSTATSIPGATATSTATSGPPTATPTPTSTPQVGSGPAPAPGESIPTLSPRGIIFLAILLILVGLFGIRRAQASR